MNWPGPPPRPASNGSDSLLAGRGGQVDEMLVTKALALLRNYPGQGVAVKMSASHREAIETLKRYGFVEEKTLVQMRLNL